MFILDMFSCLLPKQEVAKLWENREFQPRFVISRGNTSAMIELATISIYLNLVKLVTK